jgi:uncharacterized protein
MKLHAYLWAISLVVLGSAVALTTHTVRARTASPQQLTLSKPTNRSALKPGINRVTFPSAGQTLVGNLYLPASYKSGDKLPTVVVAGSWMTVKEQMSGLYAQKLADRGFAAFAFDFRSWGESGGKLRSLESPTAKIADIKNIASSLISTTRLRPSIDRLR